MHKILFHNRCILREGSLLDSPENDYEIIGDKIHFYRTLSKQGTLTIFEIEDENEDMFNRYDYVLPFTIHTGTWVDIKKFTCKFTCCASTCSLLEQLEFLGENR